MTRYLRSTTVRKPSRTLHRQRHHTLAPQESLPPGLWEEELCEDPAWLDYSSAFNMIVPSKLVSKLSNLGQDITVYRCISTTSWLAENRWCTWVVTHYSLSHWALDPLDCSRKEGCSLSWADSQNHSPNMPDFCIKQYRSRAVRILQQLSQPWALPLVLATIRPTFFFPQTIHLMNSELWITYYLKKKIKLPFNSRSCILSR